MGIMYEIKKILHLGDRRAVGKKSSKSRRIDAIS